MKTSTRTNELSQILEVSIRGTYPNGLGECPHSHFSPEDGGGVFVQSAGICQRVETAAQRSRGTEFSHRSDSLMKYFVHTLRSKAFNFTNAQLSLCYWNVFTGYINASRHSF
jgi:hypothetical protein